QRKIADDLPVIRLGDDRTFDARGTPIVSEPRLGGIGDAGVVLVARTEQVHDPREVRLTIDVAHPVPVLELHARACSKTCDSRTGSIPTDRYTPTAPVVFSESTERVAFANPASAIRTN